MATRYANWLVGALALTVAACSGGSQETETGPQLDAREASAPAPKKAHPASSPFCAIPSMSMTTRPACALALPTRSIRRLITRPMSLSLLSAPSP